MSDAIDGKALDPRGIATDEEIKRVEFSLMERLLDEKCGNGALRLSRILNRLTKAEGALQTHGRGDEKLLAIDLASGIAVTSSGMYAPSNLSIDAQAKKFTDELMQIIKKNVLPVDRNNQELVSGKPVELKENGWQPQNAQSVAGEGAIDVLRKLRPKDGYSAEGKIGYFLALRDAEKAIAVLSGVAGKEK